MARGEPEGLEDGGKEISKRYSVCLPVVGYISVEVSADTEEEALDEALNVGWSVDMSSSSAEGHVDLCELEAMPHVTQGNVSYAPMNDYDIVEIEDGETK